MCFGIFRTRKTRFGIPTCIILYMIFDSVGNGNWSTDGLETVHVITEESHTSVQCTSTHLTSFAVLVSVGGVGQVYESVRMNVLVIFTLK